MSGDSHATGGTIRDPSSARPPVLAARFSLLLGAGRCLSVGRRGTYPVL